MGHVFLPILRCRVCFSHWLHLPQKRVIFILPDRWIKPVVLISVVWSLIVWYAGEGMNMLFTGQSSMLSGAPGAVLLYPLLGFVISPRTQTSASGKVSEEGLVTWHALTDGGQSVYTLPSAFFSQHKKPALRHLQAAGFLCCPFRSIPLARPGKAHRRTRADGQVKIGWCGPLFLYSEASDEIPCIEMLSE